METLNLIHINLEQWESYLKHANTSEIYEEWQNIDSELHPKYFLKLTHEQRLELLLNMTTSEQEEIILGLTNKDITELLNDIAPDDLVDLVQKVSHEVRNAVWNNLSDESKRVTNFLLRFDYDDAAGIMTPNYVKVKPNITVAQTIEFIRKHIDEVETIYYIYIVDALDRLQGVVSLRDLFRNRDNVTLSEFMQTKIYNAQEDTDQEDVVGILKDNDLLALPVVDKFNRLLGIVTIDDAIQIISEEHAEDVLKMSAISTNNKTHPKPYLEKSIWALFCSRTPWLAILLIAGTLTSNVIGLFADLIYVAPYLVLFIPVITSTGGNTATQSTTLMIRGISRNEIDFKHILTIILKESIVAICIGFSLSIIMLARSIFFPPSLTIIEGLIISSSLIFVVLFSALIGIFAPLSISRLGADPTVIASPLIATLIDLLGLSIYFFMAKIFILG